MNQLDKDDFPIDFPEGLTETEQRLIAEALREGRPKKPERGGQQFTLASLMIFVSFLCLGLARVEWIPPSVYAGILGFLMLIAFALINLWPPKTPLIRACWAGVVVAYTMACINAVMRFMEQS